MGCGNCEFLISLSDIEYLNLYGVDYSEVSLKFAGVKLNSLNLNHIKLHQADLNNIGELSKLYTDEKPFDIIHDKGTFDAFMLLETNDHTNYISNIIDIAGKESTFIITFTNTQIFIQSFLNKRWTTKKEIPPKIK